MTHPIIKTDNYILITSDEEINIGDYWHYLGEKDNPVKNVLGRSWFEKLHDVKMYKKIIAHLPLNNSPILEGVPLLPPLPNEEYVNRLAEKEITFVEGSSDIKGMIISAERGGFVKGFSKAKEKYKFTEEDVIKAIKMTRGLYIPIQTIIQSISQPKLPVGFKCEMELNPVNHAAGLKLTGNLIMDIAITQNYTPKIINGVMQGEWIF